MFHAIPRVIAFRLLYRNFEFHIKTVCRTEIPKFQKMFKKYIFKCLKKELNEAQKKNYKIIVLNFTFKMRRRTKKSIMKF